MPSKFLVYFRDGTDLNFTTFFGESCKFLKDCKCWQIRKEGETCVTIPQEVIKMIVSKAAEDDK